MDPWETDLLAALIGQKHDVLDQVRQLSRRQTDLIAEGNTSALLGLLATKQKLLNELQDVERKLLPFRSQDPDARRWRSPADRERTRQVAERCEVLLKEIMLIEKQSEQDLVQRRDQAAARLQGVHSASQARSAYLAAGSGRGGFDLNS